MNIVTHFSTIEDARVQGRTKHPLASILTIAVLATICGADGWSGMAQFGRSKHAWLREFLDLPNGIPSEDTFGRVLGLLRPEALHSCFLSFVEDMVTTLCGQIVAIDGKTNRRSHDRGKGVKPLHLVSAWLSEHGVVLGQVATEEKSNEITAIPELLNLLDLKGAIVTVDAMGSQKKIAAQIVEQGGNWVFSLKDNHPLFHQEVALFFEGALARSYEMTGSSEFETVDGEHGRVETRSYKATSDLDWFEDRKLWAGLTSVVRVERLREMADKTEHEVSYYFSSLPADAAPLARAIRRHWGVENGLHWTLDVAFQEDLSRVRKDHGPQNLALLKKIALNQLKAEKTLRKGIALKRLRAGWDQDYLIKVLAARPESAF